MGGCDDVFEANIILRRRRLVLGVEDLCKFGRHGVVVTVDRQHFICRSRISVHCPILRTKCLNSKTTQQEAKSRHPNTGERKDFNLKAAFPSVRLRHTSVSAPFSQFPRFQTPWLLRTDGLGREWLCSRLVMPSLLCLPQVGIGSLAARLVMAACSPGANAPRLVGPRD